MSKIHLSVILFILTIIMFSCDVFYRITLVNKTPNEICTKIWWDTIPPTEDNSIEYYLHTSIKPDSSIIKSMRGSYGDMSDYKLTFYIYHIDTLKKYNNIRYVDTNRLYLRRITLTYDDLERLKWNLVIK